MDSPPPPLPAKTRRSSTAPVIVSATRHSRPHVVKIRVNSGLQPQPQPVLHSGTNTVRININHDLEELSMRGTSPYYFYTSGQSSPSDTLDSGTCSDLEHGSTPPPLPKKSGVTVTVHQRGGSLTSSGADASDDEISCDSLNSSELDGSTGSKQEEIQEEPIVHQEQPVVHHSHVHREEPIAHQEQPVVHHSHVHREEPIAHQEQPIVHHSHVVHREDPIVHHLEVHQEEPRTSPLQESIDEISDVTSRVSIDSHQPLSKKASNDSTSSRKSVVQERTYEDRNKPADANAIDPDSFYKFHLNENSFEPEVASVRRDDEDYFAGCKGFQEGDPSSATIRSSRGTIRGVKNRVRAGIATFLQIQSTKTWQEREAGKVVVYTTTMGIVRSTYQRCLKVRQILRTHLVKYEEKDVFMSRETQAEIRERMNMEEIVVPQVFIEGQYIGDAEAIERLNESGELRRILKPYKSPDACTTCQVCGGYRLLPCAVCNGSKKSVHRNHFTTELVALKCMNCDEVGLVKCYAC